MMSNTWSSWVVAAAVLVAFNSYGAFLILALISPLIAMSNHVWHLLPAITVTIANAVGIKAQYVWAGTTDLATGLLFAVLALKKPRNRIYEHAAILLLGIL